MPGLGSSRGRCATCADYLDDRDADHASHLPNGRARSYCGDCRRSRQALNRAHRNGASGAATVSTVGRIDWDAARTFGVEIETSVPRLNGVRLGSYEFARNLEAEFSARGLRIAEAVPHHVAPHWTYVPDGSIASWEIVTPSTPSTLLRTNDEGFATLRLACEAIRAAGGTVDEHTGLHVHHQGADLNLDAIRGVIRMYEAHRESIAEVIAPSRRDERGRPGATWARYWEHDSEGSHDWNRLLQMTTLNELHRVHPGRGYPHNRYHAVNVNPHSRGPVNGTLEFRAHQGTLNAAKVSAWVRLTAAIVRYGATGPVNGTADFDSLLQLAPERDRDLWVARRAIFAHRATHLPAAATYR